MSQPGNILLLACYELGHQPLSLAWPAAVLRQAGFEVTAVDLAVDPLPQEAAAQARFVGVAVPMHTALRLGVRAAETMRALNPTAHLCFFGLYAWLNADYLLAGVADSVIAGESEAALAEWAAQVLATGALASPPAGVSTRERRGQPELTRLALPTPDRRGLPDLSRYARYLADGRYHLAGYVEASRGCLHTCRHCPITPVYSGRFFVVPAESVLADVRQQVAAGAEHITFGDPDFLNGPGHVLKIARALHAEFPHLTFDFTTKVEHILQHRALMPELRALGAAFVVSAFESVSDDVLRQLHKGHTRAGMDEALDVLNAAGLPVQPTWLPFTPWTSLDDYLDLLAWIRARDLIAHVPAVQLSIRLLVPPGSALLDDAGWLGPLDAANFTYTWRHPDPCMDELQRRVAAVAERIPEPYEAFAAIERLAYGLAGRRAPAPLAASLKPTPPRLTEDWFC
ncbi:CUAEP/CCAEP-tail radical SAM (seleno)protein [Promineifilum sp.]|uniref:CUAEP/CCAEP-tail radical SAM (seleno)protein n=1 Tax=Promineifilum sp. TaxID=2664178 RepID=UPI0035B0288B